MHYIKSLCATHITVDAYTIPKQNVTINRHSDSMLSLSNGKIVIWEKVDLANVRSNDTEVLVTFADMNEFMVYFAAM